MLITCDMVYNNSNMYRYTLWIEDVYAVVQIPDTNLKPNIRFFLGTQGKFIYLLHVCMYILYDNSLYTTVTQVQFTVWFDAYTSILMHSGTDN